jgi:AdoMet-dependent heme synthase
LALRTFDTSTSFLAPKVIAWESTRACKYACVHCRAQAQNLPDQNQLTTQEALKLIDDISGFCKPIFIISGGDPLERADIFRIAKHASVSGMRVVMSPSGTGITRQVVTAMKDSGVKMISLSLDGSTPEIHDNFRQVSGAFDLVISNVSCAKEEKMPFRINTTVTKHNLDDLSNILELTHRVGAVEWDVFMLVPTGRGKVNMEITPYQYESTLEYIHNLSLTSPIPIKMTCAPQYTRIAAQNQKNLNTKAISRGCMTGRGFCFISHIGDVFGCGFLPISAGNIRKQPFQMIYQHSRLFAELRQLDLLKGKCGICGFSGLCGGCRARALATSGDYLDEEPYCPYSPDP